MGDTFESAAPSGPETPKRNPEAEKRAAQMRCKAGLEELKCETPGWGPTVAIGKGRVSVGFTAKMDADGMVSAPRISNGVVVSEPGVPLRMISYNDLKEHPNGVAIQLATKNLVSVSASNAEGLSGFSIREGGLFHIDDLEETPRGYYRFALADTEGRYTVLSLLAGRGTIDSAYSEGPISEEIAQEFVAGNVSLDEIRKMKFGISGKASKLGKNEAAFLQRTCAEDASGKLKCRISYDVSAKTKTGTLGEGISLRFDPELRSVSKTDSNSRTYLESMPNSCSVYLGTKDLVAIADSNSQEDLPKLSVKDGMLHVDDLVKLRPAHDHRISIADKNGTFTIVTFITGDSDGIIRSIRSRNGVSEDVAKNFVNGEVTLDEPVKPLFAGGISHTRDFRPEF
jgi:hypothetical protein